MKSSARVLVIGGGFGFRVNKSLALAMRRPELEIEILGERRHAIIRPDSPFAPANKRLGASEA